MKKVTVVSGLLVFRTLPFIVKKLTLVKQYATSGISLRLPIELHGGQFTKTDNL